MKKLLLIIFLCLSLNANINQAVLGIIGSSDFNTHRNLINTIFKNQSYFYTNGSLDYAKISQTLQNNNLLKLSLGSTQTIEATFIFNSNPKKSFKNINDILKSIGIQNFVTINQSVSENQLKWSIKVQTAAAINPLRLSQEQQNNIVGNRKDVIKKNIDLIKKAKIAETYDANKDMLGKVTLGETMRRIAQDSAYIMGRILQAGLQGYENNSSSRDENKNQIVGKYYPLIFDENKQEVAPYGSFGVNEYEAKFVDEFYNAIAEGIVKDIFENNQNNSDSFTSLEVKKLLGRINNTELSSGNPFKPFFNSVAANIMERSAIAAYFTRGKDPNILMWTRT